MASTFHSFIFYGFVLYLLVNVFDASGLLPRSWLAAMDFGVVGNGLGHGRRADVPHPPASYFLIRRFLVKPKTMRGRPTCGDVKQAPWRDSLIVGFFILIHVGSRLL